MSNLYGEFNKGDVFFNERVERLDVVTRHYIHTDSISSNYGTFDDSRDLTMVHIAWTSNGYQIRDARFLEFDSCNTKSIFVFEVKLLEIGWKEFILQKPCSLRDLNGELKAFFSSLEKEGLNIALTKERGKSVIVTDIIFDEVEVEDINVTGDTLESKYTSIVGNLSDLTKGINMEYALGDHKDLAEAFLKAKEELVVLTSKVPSKVSFIGKWLGNNKLLAKATKSVKEEYTKSQSTQDNIDYIFGVIYTKYENFIQVGENLQKSKGQMAQQIEALKELLKESNKEMRRFKKKVNVPIRMLALNTKIKTGIEKYKQRLTKIDGAIVATQATIMALSKDLPAMKTDLTDEMAISSLLNSVDDYQKMYEEVASLVTEVTEVTANKTHSVISNLLEMQIKDTHAIDYLKAAGKRSDDFTKMFTEKTERLTNKIRKDAVSVTELASTALPMKVKTLLN